MAVTFFSCGVRGVQGVKEPDKDMEEDGQGMSEGLPRTRPWFSRIWSGAGLVMKHEGEVCDRAWC